MFRITVQILILCIKQISVFIQKHVIISKTIQRFLHFSGYRIKCLYTGSDMFFFKLPVLAVSQDIVLGCVRIRIRNIEPFFSHRHPIRRIIVPFFLKQVLSLLLLKIIRIDPVNRGFLTILFHLQIRYVDHTAMI